MLDMLGLPEGVLDFTLKTFGWKGFPIAMFDDTAG